MNGIMLAMAGLALLGAAPQGADISAPVVFDRETLLAHRASGDAEVTSATDQPPFRIDFLMQIDASGKLVSAIPDRRGLERVNTNVALSAARAWTFRPFVSDGRPVAAKGVITIGSRPMAEIWSRNPAPFPALNGRDFEMLFEAGASLSGFGYTVSVLGDGTVRYVAGPPGSPADFTQRNGRILIPGEHVTHIAPQAVDALVERFRRARFFAANDAYQVRFAERSTQRLTFRSGATSKTIVDLVGRNVGMPVAIIELERAIVDAAGAARWTSGDSTTLAGLAAEGFDFRSEQARALLLRAVRLSDYNPGASVVALGLMERGVALDRPLVSDASGDPLGVVVAGIAAQATDLALLQRFSRDGWLRRVPPSDLSAALIQKGGGCDPDMTRLLLAAGADPRSADENKQTVLHQLRSYGTCFGKSAQTIDTLVDMLIARGADPMALDRFGQTPLHDAVDATVIKALIAAGARLEVLDQRGETPLFTARDDEVALALLEAGANPTPYGSDHQTLRAFALQRGMIETLAWLDAHGVP